MLRVLQQREMLRVLQKRERERGREMLRER